jgi:hypothetical protein
MPPIVHDYTQAIQRLVWTDKARAYRARPENSLMADTGMAARSMRSGLYLYLYSNRGESFPIRNKNTHHHPPTGAVVCPPGHCTLKSGKFTNGLQHHIRQNIHFHLWRPDAEPRHDHVAPQAMIWFLAFETDPVASAPTDAPERTREKYYNSLVRQWLADQKLDDPHQDRRPEHRWIPPHACDALPSKEDARKFLGTVLATHAQW